MAEPFAIHELDAGGGKLGICHLPGRNGDLLSDLDVISAWGPSVVVTMVEQTELEAVGAKSLGTCLRDMGVLWTHLPVGDYGVLNDAQQTQWPVVSAQLRETLCVGQRVLAHCYAGKGRSGMILLRLMCELGEPPDQALHRLRSARPGAVETDKQLAWAMAGQAAL